MRDDSKIQVIFCRGKGPLGFFVKEEQRDTDIRHVCAKVGELIWTTGARRGVFYGSIAAAKYLSGRPHFKAVFNPPLTPEEEQTFIHTIRTFDGQRYGLEKILKLIAKARIGFVRKLNREPSMAVKNPYCAEAVAYAAWKIGRRLCLEIGKEEPSAITPENLFKAAQLGRGLQLV